MTIPHAHTIGRSRHAAALASFLAALLAFSNAGAESYPRLFRANLVPNPGPASELARYDHVAYNYRAPLATRQAVRALNPNSIDFAWISALSVPHSDYYGLAKAICDSANAYDWWVRRADGSHLICWCGDGYESEWVLDLTDNCPRSRRGERFRDWYARTLVDSLVTRRGFHGLFLDQAHSAINWMITLDCNPGGIGIDLNRDGVSDPDTTVTQQWSLGIYDFLRQVRQRVGPNYPLVCNGAFNLVYDNAGKRLNDFANGLMFECFLHGSPLGSDFHKSFYNVNRGYYPEESCIQPLGGRKWMIITDSGYCKGLTGAEAERQKRLTLGSCLLTDAYYTRPPWEGNDWQPEYDFCLGTPVSGPDSLAGGSQGVWVREFTSGFVAVNPNSYAVTVPGRGITVPARDAVILVDPPDRVASLTLVAAFSNSIQIRFTVPGDPAGCGVPTTYILRSKDPWNATREWSGAISAAPGASQNVTANGLAGATAYRFTLTTGISGGTASAPSDTLRASTLGASDTQPPSTITDLAVSDSTQTSLTLRWSAPHDLPSGAVAAAYELRRWPDGGGWSTGTSVSGMPTPAAPGVLQSVGAPGLTAGSRYHFQIRARDAAGNWASLSNEAVARTVAPADAQPPAAIANLAVIDSTQTTLTLRWSAPADPPSGAPAAAYEMRRWTDGGSWSTGTAVTGIPAPAPSGTQQSAAAASLVAATRYHFQIRARDAANNWSSLSNEAVARTLPVPDTQAPAAITTLAVIDSTQTTLTLRWNAPADPPSGGAATAYEMRRWSDGGSWNAGTAVTSLPAPAAAGTQQSISVGSLAPALRYHFQIRARDAAGNWSPLSNEAAARTLAWPDAQAPAPITNLSATDSTETTISLQWAAPADPPSGAAAAAYEMRRWGDGGSWSTGIAVTGVPSPAAPGTVQSVAAASLSPGARHHFEIRSRDSANNWSDPSNEATASTSPSPDSQLPAAISNLAVVDSTQSSLTLRWSAPADPPSGGASSAYEMRRWPDGGSWSTGTAVAGLPAPAAPGSQQSIAVASLQAATRFHFQIRSRDAANNWSALSNEAAARTLPPPDTQAPAGIAGLTVTGSTPASLTLRWNAPSDPPSGGAAATYEMRHWTGGAFWNSGTAVSGLPAPATPGTQQSAVAGGLTAGTRYHFQIRSRDAAGNWSPLSNEASADTPPEPDTEAPAAIANLTAADVAQTTLTLHWTAPADPPDTAPAAGYDLRMWSGSGSWSSGSSLAAPAPAPPGTAHSFAVQGLAPETAYYFAIRSHDESGNLSAVSNTASAKTLEPPDTAPPQRIDDLTAGEMTPASIELRWTAPSDPPHGSRVTGYECRYWRADDAATVQMLLVSGAASPADPGEAESFVIEGLASGTRYEAAVRSFDESGNVSEPSGTVSAETPAPPDDQAPAAIADLSAAALSSSSVRLAWTSPADPPSGGAAEAYEVRVWLPGGAWETGAVVTGPPAPLPPGGSQALTIEDLAASTEYRFAVRSTDAAGNGSTSNIAVSATPPAPDTQPPGAPLELTAALEAGAVSLAWSPSAEADAAGYHVYRRRAGAVREALTATPLPWNSYDDPSLPVETTYYCVTAVDITGNESAFSQEARVDPGEAPGSPAFHLAPYPNPFHASTSFVVSLSGDGTAPSVRVYDVAGRLVRALEHGIQAGEGVRFTWDGRTDAGIAAASGLYLVRIEMGGKVQWERVGVVR